MINLNLNINEFVDGMEVPCPNLKIHSYDAFCLICFNLDVITLITDKNNIIDLGETLGEILTCLNCNTKNAIGSQYCTKCNNSFTKREDIKRFFRKFYT